MNSTPDHEKLRQMTFLALDRVKQLGPEVEANVFDRGMDEWYDNFVETCSPEQREEIEGQHKMNELFKDHPYPPIPTKYQPNTNTIGDGHAS